MKKRTSIPMSLGSLLLACICFLTMPGCGAGRSENVDSSGSKQVAVACAVSTMSATLAGTPTTAQFNTAADGSSRAVFTVPGADGQPEAHRMDVAANYPFGWSNASDSEARIVVPTEQGTRNILLSIDGYDPTTKTASLHLRDEGGGDLGTVDLQNDGLDAFFAQGPEGTQPGTTLVGQSLHPRGWFIPPGIAALCAGPQATVCAGIGIAVLIAIAVLITVILVQQSNCYADLRAARSDCSAKSNAQQNCGVATSGCNISISAWPPSISLGGPVIGACTCTPTGTPPSDAGGPTGPDDPDEPPPQPGQPPAPCPQHDLR